MRHIDCVEFQTFAGRHRWAEVHPWFVGCDDEPEHEVERIDWTWLDLRTLVNLTDEEWHEWLACTRHDRCIDLRLVHLIRMERVRLRGGPTQREQDGPQLQRYPR